MAKKMKKMLAMFMVLCMMVSMFSLTALAVNDSSSIVSTETTSDGLTATTTTTTTTTVDENGNTTVTVTIEKATDGTTSEGVTVDRDETRTESTTTNADGTETGTSWSEKGSETKEWTEDLPEEAAGLPEVKVELAPGETTTGEASESNTATGNDGTTTTITTDREVTAEASDITVEANHGEVELEAVSPDTWVDGDGDIIQGKYADGTEKTDIASRENYFDRFGYQITTNPETGETVYKDGNTIVEWQEGADYQYCGWGDYPEGYYAAIEIKTYKKDANGNILLDDNGDPVIKTTSDGAEPIQLALQDSEGNIVYAYCVDLATGADQGHFYTVDNLEAGTYYASEDSESHIRAIVKNGYWGTSNKSDENGENKTGSLAKIKDDLATAFQNGTLEDKEVTITVKDENGNEVEQNVQLSVLMQDLTEAEALAVTQAAIWTYSNGSLDVQNGGTGEVVVGVGGWYTPKGANHDRMDALYTYLISLTEEKTETIVINENNFLAENGLNLVVGDKIGEQESTDASGNAVTNGIYETALNFTLAFVPGENDDLLVKVIYTDLDGKLVEITKRLAGENDENGNYESLIPGADGSYTLKGLKLSENEDFNFDLKLQGTQYLEQGVYVYSPVGGRDASQTMVGLAEGNREVDVTMKLTVSFSVDESNQVIAQRVWHDESDPVIKSETETTPETDTPTVFRLGGRGTALETIEEEEVPLADAPKTGDNSFVWLALIVLASCSLVAMNVADKKRKEEV